jgi:polyphosphate kinase 2 (PPK2 family)
MYREARDALALALAERHARMAVTGERVLVIVEGADGAGKTSLIRHATRHLDPKRCRVVALGPPCEHERARWYFQRWIAELPAMGEIVFFDRSWYNRAALEPVLGLCTPAESEAVLAAAPRLEALLGDAGIRVIKLFLAVGRDAQAARLAERAADPYRRWKTTPIDRAATATWSAMRAAHDRMVARTPPWIMIETDDARAGRIAALRALVTELEEDSDASVVAVSR